MSSTLLTIDEAQAALRVSRAMLYRLMARGHLPKIKIGKRALLARSDIEAFIARHRVGPDVKPGGGQQHPQNVRASGKPSGDCEPP